MRKRNADGIKETEKVQDVILSLLWEHLSKKTFFTSVSQSESALLGDEWNEDENQREKRRKEELNKKAKEEKSC